MQMGILSCRYPVSCDLAYTLANRHTQVNLFEGRLAHPFTVKTDLRGPLGTSLGRAEELLYFVVT